MDFTHSEYTFQTRITAPRTVSNGLRKVFTSDPELNLELFFTIPIIAGGIILHLNAVQWVLVVLVTLLFLIAGVCRTAALLQAKNDSSLTPFHVHRIKCMGNIVVTITSGLSMLTYLLVFVPKIIQLL